MNKLTKLPPAWHGEAIDLLKQNFGAIHTSFLDSTRRAVWLGIFLNEIKRRGKEDKSIPHGSFIPWLNKNFPDLHRDTCVTYMRLGREVCEKGKFQITDFSVFSRGQLPPEAAQLIEGKTQQQLMLDWGIVKNSSGRRPGCAAGGNSTKSDKTIDIDAEALEMFVLDVNMFGQDNDLTIAAQDSPKLASLLNSLEILTRRIRKLLDARKSAARKQS
ncbi:MAG: hypothetical protein KGL39_13215 [Patescibacteria group bacterium]|nr:hypothetical protein [Patescibacteria group bacterium]